MRPSKRITEIFQKSIVDSKDEFKKSAEACILHTNKESFAWISMSLFAIDTLIKSILDYLDEQSEE